MLGGGQDAINVTTTDHRAGKFEAKFYDKVNPFSFFSNMIFVFSTSVHDVYSIVICLRFFKKRLEVLKGILDLLMLWLSTLMVKGMVQSRYCFRRFH